MTALSPARPGEIADEIATVFAIMGSRSGDEEDQDIIHRIYEADLEDLPFFSIKAACADFRKGIAGDGNWAPKPAQIRQRASAIAKRFTDELNDLTAILSAKPIPQIGHRPQTAEERRAMVDRVRGVRDRTVEAMTPLYEPKTEPPDVRKSEADREAAESMVDAVVERLRAPVKLSENLSNNLRAKQL